MKKYMFKTEQYPKMQMRLIILEVLMCLFISNINYAQDSTSNKKFNKHILFSVGSGIANYYNTNFFDNTLNEPNIETPIVSKYYFSDPNRIYILRGSNSHQGYPTHFSPFFNLGLAIELNGVSEKKFKIHHSIETNFLSFKNTYNYSLAYTLANNDAPPNYYDIVDTTQINNTLSTYSLGYRFQPTYKSFFLSLGTFVSYNTLTMNRFTKETILPYGYDPEYITFNVGHLDQFEKETIIKKQYMNFSFQIGTGAYIKLKSILLKPSFYFISDIRNGTNFYNVTLGIIYKIKS